ncbi:hypothetical protein V6N11_010217 [Hibiscus sabdariffa]|uniref:Uncharacterized protein n=1 Tax=Hibiscus sabdariffa TaxID=183260 RepID=A0ABR2PE31_9ROSI
MDGLLTDSFFFLNFTVVNQPWDHKGDSVKEMFLTSCFITLERWYYCVELGKLQLENGAQAAQAAKVNCCFSFCIVVEEKVDINFRKMELYKRV